MQAATLGLRAADLNDIVQIQRGRLGNQLFALLGGHVSRALDAAPDANDAGTQALGTVDLGGKLGGGVSTQTELGALGHGEQSCGLRFLSYLVGDLCMAGGDVHVTAPLDAGKARFLAGV